MNGKLLVPSRSSCLIFILTVIVMVTAVAVAPPMMGARPAKVTTTERARQLARSGHIEEAMELLESAIARHPAELDARLFLANLYLKNNEGSKAENEFREALRVHPESSSAAMALGAFYTNTGLFSAAESVLTDSVRDHPKLPALRQQLAFDLTAEHKYKEAAAIIRGVPLPRDAQSRVQYFRLAASIHSGTSDSHAAAHDMEEALSVTPTDPGLRWLTALAEADAGDWKACTRNVDVLFADNPLPDRGLLLLRAELATHAAFTSTLQRLHQLSLPEDQKLDLRIRSAEALAAAEKHRDAAKEFQEALRVSSRPADALLYNLAVEQYASAQYDEALATVQSLREQRDSAEVEDLAADIEERSENFPAAILDHHKAIALAPNDERYRLSLGAALLEYRDYMGSAKVFLQAAELFPNSARIHVGLGMADYFMEKYDDSESAFLRADQLDARSGRALGYLGATQADSTTGPSPTAVQVICDRADSHPENSTAVTWCGALLFRKAYLAGDLSGARAIIPRLRTASKFAPGDAVASCALGRALAWTEQFAEGRHWLEICVKLRPDSAEDHYQLSRVYQALSLKQESARQEALIFKIKTDQEQREVMAQKFAHEIIESSPSSSNPK